MADKGNVTVYEQRTGEPPKSVEEQTLEFSLMEEDEDVVDDSKADEVHANKLSMNWELSEIYRIIELSLTL